MKAELALLACAAAASAAAADSASSSARWAAVRRRLSYEKIAGYSPGSQVTDHCAIDLDQKAIAAQLAIKTIPTSSYVLQGLLATFCFPDKVFVYDYYGSDTYADDWILAAFEGTRTKFDNGNADFGTYEFEGREQAIKKGTAYMSVFMYVIRELEDALDDCERDCMECNDGSVHAWDEGVCFYTGSVEGQDGRADGALLHQLADKRCADFRTCGPEGNEGGGTAKLNYDLFDLFALGNYQLTTGNCPGARVTAGKIADKMYVPLIQGALRYAYKVDKMNGGEKEKAEGAVFAAAVLPRVHAASPDRATIIYENLGVGADDTSFGEVKHAFEHVYSDLGIDCGDVGGLWDEASGDYYPGMEPCKHTMGTLTIQEEATVRNNALAVALGATFGALFAVAACMVLYMRSREKQGQPVFKASSEEVKGVE